MTVLASLASFDRTAFHVVNVNLGPLFDQAARLLSEVWFGVLWGLILAVAIVVRRRRTAVRGIVALGLAVATSDFIGDRLLRPSFGRVRPCFSLPVGTFRQILSASNQGSLPSLHASNLFALATAATLADRRLGWVAFPLAVAVSLSRVYAGVHWPGDVLCGALWGSLAAGLAWALSGAVLERSTRS